MALMEYENRNGELHCRQKYSTKKWFCVKVSIVLCVNIKCGSKIRIFEAKECRAVNEACVSHCGRETKYVLFNAESTEWEGLSPTFNIYLTASVV
jgi:hypothetical protein